MYKNMDELPITFGPNRLATILGISRNKAYELANRPDFPKYRVGRKIIISKKTSFSGWIHTFLTPTKMISDEFC